MKFLFPLILALATCSTLNPVTLYHLSQLSPMTADPADFTVAIDVPPGVRIKDGSAKLGFTVSRDGQTIDKSFPLDRISAPKSGLPDANGVYSLFRVAPSDFQDMRAMQAKAAAWEEADPKGTSGSITAGLEVCATQLPVSKDTKTSIFLRIDPTGPFLPLVRGATLAQMNSLEILPCAANR